MTRYLLVKEVAQIVRKKPRTIKRWIEKGVRSPDGRMSIKARKINGRYLVRREEVQRILGITAEEMQSVLKELGIDEN